MNIFRCLYIFTFSLIINTSFAQEISKKTTPNEILDRAVATVKKDAGVQMGFIHTLFDADGELVLSDEGSLKLDGQKYNLLTRQMKLWCDGKSQWNYILENNEIYITEPNSPDAQNFSPVYLLNLHRNGFVAKLFNNDIASNSYAVELIASDKKQELKSLVIYIEETSFRPTAMTLLYSTGEQSKIILNNYKRKRSFDAKTFVCPIEDFPDAEVIDMRY